MASPRSGHPAALLRLFSPQRPFAFPPDILHFLLPFGFGFSPSAPAAFCFPPPTKPVRVILPKSLPHLFRKKRGASSSIFETAFDGTGIHPFSGSSRPVVTVEASGPDPRFPLLHLPR